MSQDKAQGTVQSWMHFFQCLECGIHWTRTSEYQYTPAPICPNLCCSSPAAGELIRSIELPVEDPRPEPPPQAGPIAQAVMLIERQAESYNWKLWTTSSQAQRYQDDMKSVLDLAWKDKKEDAKRAQANSETAS